VGKLDVDANPRRRARFDVRSIPTLLLFKDGQLVDRLVGVQPRAAIERGFNRFSPALPRP